MSFGYLRNKWVKYWSCKQSQRLCREEAKGNFPTPVIALISYLRWWPFISHTLHFSLLSPSSWWVALPPSPWQLAYGPFWLWGDSQQDSGEVILFSTSSTVLCNERLGLPSSHQPKGRNHWELLNVYCSVDSYSLWGTIFLKEEYLFLKKKLKLGISLYRPSFIFPLRTLWEWTHILFHYWISISWNSI